MVHKKDINCAGRGPDFVICFQTRLHALRSDDAMKREAFGLVATTTPNTPSPLPPGRPPARVRGRDGL